MNCARVGCEKMAYPGMKYCSADCAPLAKLSNRQPTQSTPKEWSSFVAHGARSGHASADEKKTPNDIGSARPKSVLKYARPSSGEHITKETLKKSGSVIAAGTATQKINSTVTKNESKGPETTGTPREETIGSGMQETSKRTEQKSASAETAETLPATSPGSSIKSDVEKSPSLNLLNDSVQHLYGLMKSVSRIPATEEEANFRMDPQKVNAACNCAKNMHNLMRLQVDVMKMVHGVGKRA